MKELRDLQGLTIHDVQPTGLVKNTLDTKVHENPTLASTLDAERLL